VGQFLRPLPAFDAHVLCLGTQHFGDAHAQLIGLNDRGHKVIDIRHLGPLGHGQQGLAARLAQPHFCHDAVEFLGQGGLPPLSDPTEGSIKAQAGADADVEHVQAVG